ncbi:DUF3883 domain-containing protein [uncultured Nocardioides sp.]|uniref:DUF3883 domain-containing protein n=1 Tax=uncultured Nocardioides sp. TaxID=198441 RepID=UPI0026381F41|nr:DUF3883 domain-containing protein [uncultured Nocardioides sp.]
MAGQSWSEKEVDLTIDTYFTMLRLELDGEAYRKAEHRRDLLSKIDRSAGSVEYKLQNISAVLDELGGVFIDGYKPASNVQGLLRERVTARLGEAADLRRRMVEAAEEPAPTTAVALGDAVAPPSVTLTTPALGRSRVARMVDFHEREARNRSLGLAGEEAVVDLERRRLAVAGRDDLAKEVRHVSVLDGDGLGYDVRSFDPSGNERFIEVKTTRYARHLPFLVTRNEVDFSEERPTQFVLYRLFMLGAAGMGHYELAGSLRSQAQLEPTTYRGLPNVG